MEIRSKQENFRLREWKLTDIDSLAKHINNVKIWNNVRDGLPYPYTMLDADKYIRMVSPALCPKFCHRGSGRGRGWGRDRTLD